MCTGGAGNPVSPRWAANIAPSVGDNRNLNYLPAYKAEAYEHFKAGRAFICSGFKHTSQLINNCLHPDVTSLFDGTDGCQLSVLVQYASDQSWKTGTICQQSLIVRMPRCQSLLSANANATLGTHVRALDLEYPSSNLRVAVNVAKSVGIPLGGYTKDRMRGLLILLLQLCSIWKR